MSKSKTSNKKGLLVVFSAPSGCGKTTVLKELFKRNKRSLWYSISATTRAPRSGERNGKDYFFISEAEFKKRVRKKQFLEWAQVFGHCYGTPRSHIVQMIKKGKTVILDVDVQGALQVMERFKGDVIFVFMVPPSLKELKKRLVGRKSESSHSIAQRFSLAKKEIRKAKQYDYIVVNNKVQDVVKVIENIIDARKHTVARNKEVLHALYST